MVNNKKLAVVGSCWQLLAGVGSLNPYYTDIL